MRPGQNRRMRGRNNNNNSGNRKAPNPLQRSYESNGPDVKVRGTAQHVAEKYLQLARDAQSSGDPVAAENYFQHAEHYYRILLAAQEQMTQQFGHSFQPNRAFVEDPDEVEDEGDEDAGFQAGQQGERQPFNGGGQGGHGAPRHEGEDGEGGQSQGQRFDRPHRQDRNFDRNGQRRFDRNDRPDRQERGGDRGERRFERHDNQNASYAPRPEAQPGAEQPDIAPAQNQGERRFERPERPERPDRPPRGERGPRREQAQARTEEQEAPAGLPAFLTTPTRVPIAIAEEPAAPEPATAAETPEAAESAEKPKRARGRRRSPREVMDALGAEGDAPAE